MTLCDDSDLEIVYKHNAKTVPLNMLKYFVDHPEEAREKLQILCRKHQTMQKFEFREFQRNNRWIIISGYCRYELKRYGQQVQTVFATQMDKNDVRFAISS